MESRSSIIRRPALFCPEEIADGHAVLHRLQFGDKFSKTFRENCSASAQVKMNARRADVMVQQFPPTFPKLGIEQAVNVMIMNRLEGLQKLVRRMKKARLIF